MNKNLYKILSTDRTVSSVLASNLWSAARYKEDTNNPVIQAELEKSDIATDTSIEVDVSVEVESTASTAGCLAYPTGTHTVTVGDSIILTAVAATGWTFSSWTRNGESVSTEAEVQLTVTDLEDGEDSAVYTANFTEDEE